MYKLKVHLKFLKNGKSFLTNLIRVISNCFKELFKNELLMKEYAKKVFKQAEKDKNGLVNRSEFENLVKKCHFNDLTVDEVNLIVNQVKDYGSGKMSFKDFLKMFSNLLNYLKKVFIFIIISGY